MVVSQGDVFWVVLPEPVGSEPGFRHPHVVVQNNVFNRGRISTVVLCAITSNLKWSSAPGNVRLRRGEANLPSSSVVNISQVLTVNKSDLIQKIGQLSKRRMEEIVEGFQVLIKPRLL